MKSWALWEAGANIALAALLLWPVRARLGTIVSTIPRRYTLSCVAGALLLLGGQIASRKAATYPIAPWDMYTLRQPEDPRFIDYAAELSSGKQERLLIGRLFPAGGRHFRSRIDQVAFTIERAPPGAARQQAIDDLDAMLAAVAQAYHARHRGDSLRAIRLWSATVPARAYQGPTSITRKLLHEYQPR